MKKIIRLLFALLIFAACEKEDAAKFIEIRIKDTKVACSGHGGQSECLLVQTGDLLDTDEWKYFYEQIEGFTFGEGFVYRLKIKRVPVENPPMDASAFRYLLVEQLSKEKV
jgi:hypothetical protein